MHTYNEFIYTHACMQYSCMCVFLHTHVHASGLCFSHLEVHFRLGGTGGGARMGDKEVRSAVVCVVVQQGCFRRCFSRPAALQTYTCTQRHPHNGCERQSQAHTYTYTCAHRIRWTNALTIARQLRDIVFSVRP